MAMNGVLRSSLTWLREKIRQRDEYPRSVQLFYKGKTEFNTFFGGFVSLIIKVLVILYGVKVMIDVIQRSNTNKSVTKQARDLLKDTTKHYIGKGTFGFAVGIFGTHPEKLLDPRYFKVSIYQNHAIRSSTNDIPVYDVIEIEYDNCDDKFPFVSEKLFQRLGLHFYIWPKNTDYFISAAPNSDEFNTIDMRITRWLGDDCATDAQIDEVINNNWIDVQTVNAYFDFNNIENPVQTYLMDINTYPLFVGQSNLLSIVIAQNEYITNDNLFYSGSDRSGTFYSVASTDLRPRNELNYRQIGKGNVFQIFIYFSTEYFVYERSSFTFFDMFGLLGGIHQLFILFGGYVVGIFAERLFDLSILSKLYQVKTQLNNRERKVNPIYEVSCEKLIDVSNKRTDLPDEVSNKFLDINGSLSKYETKKEEI